jgi:hypothetical protein
MAGAGKVGAGDVALGPFEVVAEQDSIADFALAIGQQTSEPSATFPIVWLSLPALKQALRATLGAGHLAIHESQSFDYERPLTPGGRYMLSGVARRESGPDRLVVTVQAADEGGRIAVAMRSVLRIVAVSGDGLE